MECRKLVSTLNLPEDTWLDIRRGGVTGTNVSALAGVNNYTSGIDVYIDKLGLKKEEEKPDNEYMYFGRKLEAFVANEFKERHPNWKIKRINAVLQHKEYDWVLGDIDREITNEKGEKGILEIKTGSEYSIEKWEGENIPDAYMIQLQWYLFLTGYKYGYFAALLGGHRYIEKYVQRDDELIKSLFQIAEDFWFNNIGKKVPPAADGSEASAKALEILHPQAVYTGGLELPPEIELLVIEREDAKVKLKELENLIDEKDNKIKEYMGDYAEAVTSDYIVKWGNKKGAERFDTKRFKAEHPEIAKDYIVIGEPSRSFSIKKKK